jgi:hypothetical protein
MTKLPWFGWREKRGDVAPEYLSGNLIVQLGVAAKELNRRWYEANLVRSSRMSSDRSAIRRFDAPDLMTQNTRAKLGFNDVDPRRCPQRRQAQAVDLRTTREGVSA